MRLRMGKASEKQETSGGRDCRAEGSDEGHQPGEPRPVAGVAGVTINGDTTVMKDWAEAVDGDRLHSADRARTLGISAAGD